MVGLKMKINIEITDGQVSEIVRNDLIQCYVEADPDNRTLTSALVTLIGYYSNVEQYQDFLKSIGQPSFTKVAMPENSSTVSWSSYD